MQREIRTLPYAETVEIRIPRCSCEPEPMRPKNKPDDCFALPPGFHWTPVDEVLASLRQSLKPVTESEWVPVSQAAGRITARPVLAERLNPAASNSAVDGYGFAFASLSGGQDRLCLMKGRAAAGATWDGSVLPGFAVRVLTGAELPDGVDTVVLDENSQITGQALNLPESTWKGANTRLAGEDARTGQELFTAGEVLRPQDIGCLVACGVSKVKVRNRLRVGIISTGDELKQPGEKIEKNEVYDANKPMLRSLVLWLGFHAVDLGHFSDDRDKIRAGFDDGAARVDAILTTGGASSETKTMYPRFCPPKENSAYGASP